VEQLRNLDLNLLHALHALLEEASVSRAAARLGLSTPALSHALARLRRTLNDPLLERAGRTMVPSPRAVELRPLVRAVVHDLERVFAPGEAFAPSTSTRRFLLLGSDYVILVLGRALDRLVHEAAPSVQLQFMPNTQADADAIRESQVDLAIGVYHELHPEIRIQKLFDEELVCVVRRDHPRIGKRLSLAQYANLEHIQVAPRGRPGGVIEDALARQGLQRRVVRQVPFFVAGLVLVADSDYALTIPRRLAIGHADVFRLRVLNLPIALEPYSIVQIWHPRRQGDAGLRWLRQQVVEASTKTRPARR